MFEAGVINTLTKLASLDATVHKVVTTALKAHLPAGKAPAQGDDLEDLLPEDGALESLVQTLEENFDVVLPTDVVFGLFSGGTVKALEKALTKALVSKKPTKTAAYDSHAYYMRNRAKRRQQARQYRMRNLHKVRRRAKVYRRRVRTRAHRPRRRVGTAAGGYTFVQR